MKDEATAALEAAQAAIAQMGTVVESQEKKLSGFSAVLKDIKGALKDYAAAATASSGLESGWSSLVSRATALNGSLGGAGQALAPLGPAGLIDGGAIAAVTGYTFESIESFAKFEQMGVRLRAQLHGTGQDGKISIEELKTQAIELSATTSGNPDDLMKKCIKSRIATSVRGPRRRRVQHHLTRICFVVERDDQVQARRVAAGMEPRGGVEAQQAELQAADRALRQREKRRSLKVDDTQNLAATNHFLHASLAILRQPIQDDRLFGVEGRNPPLPRQGRIDPVDLGIGQHRVLDAGRCADRTDQGTTVQPRSLRLRLVRNFGRESPHPAA